MKTRPGSVTAGSRIYFSSGGRYHNGMSRKKKKNELVIPPTDARIILFTGKGGVGKTSVSAATAVLSAEAGSGTLIMSTDAAHSLSDSFEKNIGSEPTPIADRLWGLEIDINEQISQHWGAIHSFLTQFMRSRGISSVIADELAIMPGMEEIFSLLAVKHWANDERFDVVIIDCAPTADTARLLAIPDIAQWYMEKIFHIERAVIRTVRPVAKRLIDAPLPSEAVYDSVEILYNRILGVKELLTDRTKTSIRMVLNPEKMVIKEAQRAYTFLCLFDFGIDAIVVNRLLPQEITDPYYDRWHEIQTEHMATIRESFEPLPILTAPLWKQEMTGLDLLKEMAREIYQDQNPADIFHQDRQITITPVGDQYVMEVPIPFAAREDMETWINGDELIIKFRNFKRNLILPRSLAKQELIQAELKDRSLKLVFEGETHASNQ